MHSLLTTQSQNSYREQIHKEMMMRLTWKQRYSRFYPTNQTKTSSGSEPGLNKDSIETGPGPLQGGASPVLPPITMTTMKRSNTSLSSVSLPVTSLPVPAERARPFTVPPVMRPASPQTRQSLYQGSSHQGRGRSQYLRSRGLMLPEQKFDFPLVSSWEYGWRLGDFTLDYKTPTRARSSVVKSTFYARNGVFNSPSPTDALG
ncbi:protein ATP6V1FNB isoform X2 [Periophthalmus magnuspinnatus]|uniref:protein ATP6V1FNB isoform X2 n=1 Tax=Periophthalmus magnuspinnatus TaxID=409849 RepID=UPI00243687CC|nr:protein ATP6V1FNB isoform X2 [Periophthalmus magnuspinnatus]